MEEAQGELDGQASASTRSFEEPSTCPSRQKHQTTCGSFSPPPKSGIRYREEDEQTVSAMDAPEVTLDEDLLAASRSELESSLIGQIIGQQVRPSVLMSQLPVLWRLKGDFEMLKLRNRFFHFKFELREDMEHVKVGCPWTVAGQQLLVAKWVPNFDPIRAFVTAAPVWVLLPDLPLEFWKEEFIKRMVGTVGQYIKLDRATASEGRVGFKAMSARVLVEVDLSRPLPRGLSLQLQEGRRYQKLLYEGLPKPCRNCNRVSLYGACSFCSDSTREPSRSSYVIGQPPDYDTGESDSEGRSGEEENQRRSYNNASIKGKKLRSAGNIRLRRRKGGRPGARGRTLLQERDGSFGIGTPQTASPSTIRATLVENEGTVRHGGPPRSVTFVHDGGNGKEAAPMGEEITSSSFADSLNAAAMDRFHPARLTWASPGTKETEAADVRKPRKGKRLDGWFRSRVTRWVMAFGKGGSAAAGSREDDVASLSSGRVRYRSGKYKAVYSAPLLQQRKGKGVAEAKDASTSSPKNHRKGKLPERTSISEALFDDATKKWGIRGKKVKINKKVSDLSSTAPSSSPQKQRSNWRKFFMARFIGNKETEYHGNKRLLYCLEPDNHQYSYAEITHMTDRFMERIGSGGFGSVYRGKMADGTHVAIKLLSHTSRQGDVEFRNEVQLLLKLHHKNLVPFIGYCIEGEHKALLYEYMAQGDLDRHLTGTSYNALSWSQRLRIAVGVAEGLLFLHEYSPPIIHRDLKSSNILLDEKFEAKIADFGLSKSFDDDCSHVTTRVMGTIGYMDPEYAFYGRLTKKTDVYGFGVVLLQLITGKPPAFGDIDKKIGLIDWAKDMVGDGKTRLIIDPRIEGGYEIYSIEKTAEIALACTASRSSERPSMNTVVKELQECRALHEGPKELGESSTEICSDASDYGR